MSKVLIYIGSHDNNCINAALERLERGDDVLVIRCDRSTGICRHNMFGSQLECRYCEYVNNSLWEKRMIKEGARVKGLKDLITKEDRTLADALPLDYNNVDELKAITYNGIEVGFGAFSTYATLTRNVMPEFTDEFKGYVNFMIRREIAMILAIERELVAFKPEVVILHNGRFAEFKPILGLTLKYKIPYITTEEIYYNGVMLKNNFDNAVVHSVEANYQKVIKNWDKGEEPEDRKKAIAEAFYNNRVKGIAAGDKVYTSNQVKGQLPEGFDESVENISIFNSSEDEFCSVSSEFDKNMLFKNQYIALKTIFEHYKDDKTKHFYLRIHPNLMNVPYRSHMALYELHYDNVTVIPADSSIDSYVLMFHSDKIITFNSTMSIESTYWGKPVIALNRYIWNLMGVVYSPKNEEELWGYIDTSNLACLKNENVYKFPYRILHPIEEPEDRIRIVYKEFSFFGRRHVQTYCFFKFLGSYRLNELLKIVFHNHTFRRLFKRTYLFDRLPSA